ncbi:MAG: extracellular solute-binding protein [Anaerolineae bacterium]
MSRKWMYLFVLAILVVPMLLTACGPTAEPTSAPEPTQAEVQPTEALEEPTAAPEEPETAGPYDDVDPTGATVLWWHQHTKERAEGLNEMVAEFNETNEWGITVNAEYAGGYSEIYDKMIAAIAADDPTLMPNLTVGYANQVAKYQLTDALVDMDYFVDSPKWGLTEEEIADFPKGIFEADVSPVFGDGHFRMGFPPNRSMEVMYYNQDWLTELGYDGPPKTWDEFAEMVCAATDPDAGTIGYEISTDASRFASLVFSRHGTYFLEDGSSFDFLNDTVKESMAFMKDLYDQGCIGLMAEAYGDQTDFGNYKTLFTIGSTSGVPYYDSAVKSGEQGEFVWGVAALPYMDGGDEPVMNLYGASVSVPVTTPEQELASWLFVKWFTEPEQNARWAKISGYFPTRISAADAMTDYMEANPVYAQGFELMPYSTYEAQWCACYEEVRRMMEDAYSAILDGADIDSTLAQLQQDANVSLFENTPEGFEPGALTPTEPEPEVAAGPYDEVDPTGATVLWWHQHTKERAEGLNEMVAEFNETNEWGITVNAEYAGGYSEIYDKMIAAIAADDPTLMPNLTVGYANQVAKYQLTDALVDMDYFVDSPKWGLTEEEIADFPKGIFEADVSPVFGDGHFRMGFPPNRSMEVMYYNQDWLTELGYDGPPKTWDEFAEMVCAATDPDAGTIGYEISTDASRFASLVFSRHGTYFLEDGSSFDFLNDTVKESMAFMKDLYDQGCIGLMAEAYGDQTDFGNYKTLFTIGSTSGVPYYDSAVKSGEQGEFVWGVAALPYMDGGDEPVMNLYGASVSVPVTTPEQELASWLFVKWFTEPEQNARWAKISGYFPTRISAADAMTDYMEANPVYAQGFELMPYSTYEAQWCACYEEVRRLMEDAYSAILDGADIDATLAQLQEDANVSLAENTP